MNKFQKPSIRQVFSGIACSVFLLLITCKAINAAGALAWRETWIIPIELIVIAASFLVGGVAALVGKLFVKVKDYKAHLLCFAGVTVLSLCIIWRLNFVYFWKGFPQFIDAVFVIPAGAVYFILLYVFLRDSKHA